MKILFWNLNNNDLSDFVAQCVHEHCIDIVCLAEHQDVAEGKLCRLLGSEYSRVKDVLGAGHMLLFYKWPILDISAREQTRYAIWSFEHQSKRYNLVSIHLPDRRNDPTSAARLDVINDIKDDLFACELETGCLNSIIIGDFNAGPYDIELIRVNAFNATLFKDVIKRNHHRVWLEKTYDFMYNPILSFLSEESKCYGSYYLSNTPDTPYWCCIDQCIVREPLVDCLSGFEYLRSIGNTLLVREAGPLRRISDHLPLLVTIN